MSREQLYLSGFLGLLVLLALPAFLLSTPSDRPEPGTSETESVLASSSVPDTELNMEETTEDQREKIRHQRKVNINTADSAALSELPNIGPNRAEAILAYRDAGNVFRNQRDLRNIEGFGDQTAEQLAQHVRYGEENYQEPSGTGEGSSGKIDVNEASVEELATLSDVGEVTAQRIVDYRESEGGIDSYADLNRISGLGKGTIENFKDQIEELSGDLSGSGGSSGTVNVNTAGVSELTSLTGVGTVTAEAIVSYREENGDFESLDDLDAVDGIGSATIEDLRSEATVN